MPQSVYKKCFTFFFKLLHSFVYTPLMCLFSLLMDSPSNHGRGISPVSQESKSYVFQTH